ncbi:MAG: hypothetical protein KKB13_12555, partial [Chloroflexi bacterium]|nr:hypothetical protein [Chloroflexota bacterium]
EESLEALAGMVLNDGFCCRYNAPGPPPARMREGLPCAWGAVKALAALAWLPAGQRSPAVRDAIQAGVEFLLEGDLAGGGFPTATTPSRLWHSFGFPLGYTSDLLEVLAVLARLGMAGDPRLAGALEIVRRKQDGAGRWRLEYAPRNSWADWGALARPNKWLTLRALYVLEAAAWQAVGENG